MYRLTNAGISYGPIPALADVSLTLEGRQFVSIIGPNGAGKSTLLGLLAGMKPNYAGLLSLREQRGLCLVPPRLRAAGFVRAASGSYRLSVHGRGGRADGAHAPCEWAV